MNVLPGHRRFLELLFAANRLAGLEGLIEANLPSGEKTEFREAELDALISALNAYPSKALREDSSFSLRFRGTDKAPASAVVFFRIEQIPRFYRFDNTGFLEPRDYGGFDVPKERTREYDALRRFEEVEADEANRRFEQHVQMSEHLTSIGMPSIVVCGGRADAETIPSFNYVFYISGFLVLPEPAYENDYGELDINQSIITLLSGGEGFEHGLIEPYFEFDDIQQVELCCGQPFPDILLRTVS